MHNRYGYYLRILHWCTDQAITAALAKMDLTASQGPILGFIQHSPVAPCSRDIEEEFHLSHPTVSGILSRLEKKGFIEFRPDPADRRCKRIYILEKGRLCNETVRIAIQESEQKMVQDFTEDEKAQFLGLLTRAIANMGGSPCQRNHKEEINE